MTAPLREQFKNAAQTALDGSINNSVTSITVDTGSVFPSAGNLRILIESEILLVTARSSNTLTVVRAQEGTAAASHADDLPVTMILTAGSQDRGGKDNVSLWGSSAPPLNKIVDDAGVVIDSTGFTWVNQGSATVTDQSGTIVMRTLVVGSDSLRILKRTAPSAPYSYIAAFQTCSFRINATLPVFGIGFRDSSGKLISFLVVSDSTGGVRIQISKWNSETSYNSDVASRENVMLISPQLWLKIEDNNTNLLFSISADGIEWIQVGSIGRTSFTTAPDQVFWYSENVGAGGGSDFLTRLVHWSRAS